MRSGGRAESTSVGGASGETVDERLRITYVLTLAPGEDPEGRAREIALEQTVELPDGRYPPGIEQRVVGRLERLSRCDGRRWQATLAYPALPAGDDLPQLLNLVFGNISMMRGIRVVGLELPSAVVRRYPGPRLGMAGIRELAEAQERPLVCAAAKPMGLSSVELAARCAAFARSGIDIVKDDHGVTNQPTAPFGDRVGRCQDAVEAANRETGGRTLYFPNVTAPHEEMVRRALCARDVGCRGVIVSPMLVGLDSVRAIADASGLAVFSHPTFSGGLFHPEHGVSPEILYGLLFRLAGSDGVIYTNAGGRFPFTEEVCERINRNLREPLDGLKPAFPVAGGGVDVQRVLYWIDRYGHDMVFLIGSSLYAQDDLEQASRELVDAVRRHCHVGG